MINTEQAQTRFDARITSLSNDISKLIDDRLINFFPRLHAGEKLSISIDVIAKTAFLARQHLQTRFDQNRELVIVAMKQAYEASDWEVLYGTTGKADITNERLELVFSIKKCEESAE